MLLYQIGMHCGPLDLKIEDALKEKKTSHEYLLYACCYFSLRSFVTFGNKYSCAGKNCGTDE
jgi:hypothetical protein